MRKKVSDSSLILLRASLIGRGVNWGGGIHSSNSPPILFSILIGAILLGILFKDVVLSLVDYVIRGFRLLA